MSDLFEWLVWMMKGETVPDLDLDLQSKSRRSNSKGLLESEEFGPESALLSVYAGL